ncbi:hypothetical protein V8C26DRAFT_407333 [Trichoderma gracile]
MSELLLPALSQGSLLGPRMAFRTTGGDNAALCSSSLDRRRKHHHETLQKEPWKIAQGGLSRALAKASPDEWTPQQAPPPPGLGPDLHAIERAQTSTPAWKRWIPSIKGARGFRRK